MNRFTEIGCIGLFKKSSARRSPVTNVDRCSNNTLNTRLSQLTFPTFSQTWNVLSRSFVLIWVDNSINHYLSVSSDTLDADAKIFGFCECHPRSNLQSLELYQIIL